jgi:hypothetical protein
MIAFVPFWCIRDSEMLVRDAALPRPPACPGDGDGRPRPRHSRRIAAAFRPSPDGAHTEVTEGGAIAAGDELALAPSLEGH